METKRIYRPLTPIGYTEAMDILKKGSLEQQCLLPMQVGQYWENAAEAQSICLSLLDSDYARVRAKAVQGLSYIARRHKKLDKRVVKPYLIRELRENEEFREEISYYVEDINLFLGWHIGEKQENRG